MRFINMALACALLLINLAMISSLAHFTPMSVKSEKGSSHVTLEINHVEADETSVVQPSIVQIVQPKSVPVSVVGNSTVERSTHKSFSEIVSKMSMSHTVWILMSTGLILILAIPDVTHLYMKIARKKK